MRHQRLVVLALVACHDVGMQPPANLLAELVQAAGPGSVEPAHRAVLQGRWYRLADAAKRLRPGLMLCGRQLLPNQRRRGASCAVAQVFNERGDVVVRGGTATISKTDRRPHLAEADASKLLSDALAEYRCTHGHQLARIVLQRPRSSTQLKSPGSRAQPTIVRSTS
jgi:hypothetical protein